MHAKLCVFNPRASPLTSQFGVSTELLQNHLVTVVVATTESFSNDMLDQLRQRSEQHLSVQKSRSLITTFYQLQFPYHSSIGYSL